MILLCFINNSNYRRVNKMSTYMSMRNILTKHFEKKSCFKIEAGQSHFLRIAGQILQILICERFFL